MWNGKTTGRSNDDGVRVRGILIYFEKKRRTGRGTEHIHDGLRHFLASPFRSELFYVLPQATRNTHAFVIVMFAESFPTIVLLDVLYVI